MSWISKLISILIPRDLYELYKAKAENEHRTVSNALVCTLMDAQKKKTGEWKRMSELSDEEDDRYQCSNCGNIVHYMDRVNLYTFNNYCGRCGSYNGSKIFR